MIKVSVIITSYNNSHNLERCLSTLFNQQYDRHSIDLEIIFIDSGSTDNSIEILNKYKDKIKVILKPFQCSYLSPAMARNIGVQYSKGDILIFSDSDCVFLSNWIKEMVASFENQLIDCVIGNREPDSGQGIGTFVRRYDFILYSNKFSILRPIIINKKKLAQGGTFVLLAANNFAIKKEIWNKLGGMKTIFKHPAGEDIMLEIQLLKNGYTILFNPFIKINHIHPLSLTTMFKKAFQYGEATYILGKYSSNFVNWRHFAKRGHIFNLQFLCLVILLVIFILLLSIFLKIPFLIISIIFFGLLLTSNILYIIRTGVKLRFVLKNKKEAKYKNLYQLSLLHLFCFTQIHLFLKTIALISFLWCLLIKKKYAFT